MAIERNLKYLVLYISLCTTLVAVFFCVSYYLARRSIDAEIDTKKLPSLEYLQTLDRRDRMLVSEALDMRCAEREEIGFYQAQNSIVFDTIYRHVWSLKATLIQSLSQSNSAKSYSSIIADLNKWSFSFSNLSPDKLTSYLSKQDKSVVSTTDFADLLELAGNVFKSYTELSSEIEGKEDALKAFSSHTLLNMKALDERLGRLASAKRRNEKVEVGGEYDEVLSRYTSWTSGLTANDQALARDDTAFAETAENNQSLSRVENCAMFRAFYNQASLSNDNIFYNVIGRFFVLPPVAQTLLVTLLLGALGAETLNVLRLSDVGWWGLQPEPTWGELLTGPVIGALAAFGIFLLGSTGLLLTTDGKAGQSGVSSLSAFFIGLLGFLSGLMYDEAFSRVRQVGLKLFAGDTLGATNQTGVVASNDVELAGLLTKNGASIVAGLVTKFSIADALAQLSSFTFLIPSDTALQNDKSSVLLDPTLTNATLTKWLDQHLAKVRLVSGDITPPGEDSVTTIVMNDGRQLPIARNKGVLIFDKSASVALDILWKNGVVHILQSELGS